MEKTGNEIATHVKDPDAVALGRLGGQARARARALKLLTPEQKSEAAKKASRTRLVRAVQDGPRDSANAKARRKAYQAWCNAKQRCTDPLNASYDAYGGRGIKFLFETFEQFLAEIGVPPEGKSLDRINNDGHYEPGNIRWATRQEQGANKRRRRKRLTLEEALVVAREKLGQLEARAKAITTVTTACTCVRCGHKWETSSVEPPIRCAKCKSCYWNRPQKRGESLR